LGYKDPPGIDLHIHSDASDGTLTPSEILTRASRLGLRAIAITDHDTIDGSKAALNLDIPASLKLLSGVEVSAAPPSGFPVTGSFHILGYGIRLDDPALIGTLKKLQIARKNRNPLIINRLKQLGIDISLADIQAKFGDKQLGRPHIAQFMVQAGIANSIDEVFDNYLGKHKPAYVDKYRIRAEEAVHMIRNAGGIAVLAHPFLLDTNGVEEFETLLVHLKDLGLGGMEVYYPSHPVEVTHRYAALAKRYGLLMTGGTDFHGALNTEIEMGCGNGSFHVPYQLYETLVTNLDRSAR